MAALASPTSRASPPYCCLMFFLWTHQAEEEFVALEASLSTGAVVLPPSLPWIAGECRLPSLSFRGVLSLYPPAFTAAAVELPPKSDNAVLRRLAREVQGTCAGEVSSPLLHLSFPPSDATTACDNLDAEAAKLIQRVKAIVK